MKDSLMTGQKHISAVVLEHEATMTSSTAAYKAGKYIILLLKCQTWVTNMRKVKVSSNQAKHTERIDEMG